MTLIKNIIKEIRPKHWIKNVLIFAPLFFSWNLLNIDYYIVLVLWFLSFSLIASSVYVINDLCDIEKDKLHEKKKLRPIASWKISKRLAYLLIILLWTTWFWIWYLTNIMFFYLLFIYFVSNLMYSIKVKHMVIYDILFISMMYVMRVLWWALIINTNISSYIFVTVFFWSMFLITAKRYSELISENSEKRKVLEFYNQKVLFSIFIMSMTSSLVSYTMYTISKGEYYFYSIIFVSYIFMKYVYLVFWEWKWEEPEVILLNDKWILISIIWWLIFSIYFYYNYNFNF